MHANWKAIPDSSLHETKMLRLDSTKAHRHLAWKPVLTMDQQISLTAEWYSVFRKQKAVITREQLGQYQDAAKHAKAVWA
jgi:CDP-glucose 4,6-dehydratase